MAFLRPFLAIFFANCMVIFHKTEVQTVILRCLTGLHLDWFRHYGLRCKWRPCTCLANSQKIATDKWPFYDHIWPFFANYIFIFHKTEVRTIILKCITSLNPNWYKSYDTKRKNARYTNECFCTKLPKIGNGNICSLNKLEFRPIKHIKMTV